MDAFTLWIDGAAYCGETEQAEPQPPQSGSWWLHAAPQTRNSIAVGGAVPYIVEGRRNLASHLERLLSRHREGRLPFREITIRLQPRPEA